MKFALASDLHLHFGNLFLENTENADVLILAGDIYEAVDLPGHHLEHSRIKSFFLDIASKFKEIIWVAGNHEHYGSTYPESHNIIRNWLSGDSRLSNIKFMEKEVVEYGDTRVLCSTLWASMRNGDPLVMHNAKSGMSDYGQIYNWSPTHELKEHRDSLKWLEDNLDPTKKNLIVTHHHPCWMSVQPQYRSGLLQYNFYSELSEWILDNPSIKFWCAGHIHENIKYNVGECTVLCNPRGYHGYEPRTKMFKLEYFDL